MGAHRLNRSGPTGQWQLVPQVIAKQKTTQPRSKRAQSAGDGPNGLTVSNQTPSTISAPCAALPLNGGLELRDTAALAIALVEQLTHRQSAHNRKMMLKS